MPTPQNEDRLADARAARSRAYEERLAGVLRTRGWRVYAPGEDHVHRQTYRERLTRLGVPQAKWPEGMRDDVMALNEVGNERRVDNPDVQARLQARLDAVEARMITVPESCATCWPRPCDVENPRQSCQRAPGMRDRVQAAVDRALGHQATVELAEPTPSQCLPVTYRPAEVAHCVACCGCGVAAAPHTCIMRADTP